MRNPIELIRARLVADPAITALVGQRVFMMQVPQEKAPPLLLLYPVGTRAAPMLNGRAGMQSATIAVEARAALVGAANELGEAVFDCLDGYGGTISGITIRSIVFTRETFLQDDLARVSRRIMDFTVHISL